MRRIALEELRRYPTVEVRTVAVSAASAAGGGFALTFGDGAEDTADKLILATGVVDELPAIPGLAELWGRAAFHCPYCDAFERSDQPLAVVDSTAMAGFSALQLTSWSSDVVLCTNGPTEFADDERSGLSTRGIRTREEAIVGFEPDGDGARLVFDDGPPLERRAVFLRPPTRQRSDLATQLGCAALDDGSIEINDFAQTSVPGVFAVGDMARRPAMPFPAAQAIHAASAGGIAAVVVDMELVGAGAKLEGRS